MPKEPTKNAWYCAKCREEGQVAARVYDFFCNDERICPDHNMPLVEIDFPYSEYDTLWKISDNVDFMEAMLKLKQDDIIEYETKMAQFRTQVAQMEAAKQTSDHQVTCPYCQSVNVRRISTADRMVSTGFFGLGSRKVGKQFHCNGCGADF
ncbi:MAG: hypothetical protein HFG80_10120 [Eubacterium sp.]|nr:hypothetical protein [Eubacterium sp.]